MQWSKMYIESIFGIILAPHTFWSQLTWLQLFAILSKIQEERMKAIAFRSNNAVNAGSLTLLKI